MNPLVLPQVLSLWKRVDKIVYLLVFRHQVCYLLFLVR